jgi:hypothetical protein
MAEIREVMDIISDVSRKLPSDGDKVAFGLLFVGMEITESINRLTAELKALKD